MPDFTNPFPGMREEGDLDTGELTRALRLDLSAEQDATHLYSAQAARTKNPAVKRSLLSIADEERIHAGEFLRLIQETDRNEAKLVAQGMREVETREKLEHDMSLDMMAESLLLHSVPDAFGLGGIVVNEAVASAGPCMCTKVDSSELCHSKGIIGFLNEAEKAKYCHPKIYTQSPALEKRLGEFKEAVAVCKAEVATIPKGERIGPYLSCMGFELKRRGVTTK